jgi:hypothetical protein
MQGEGQPSFALSAAVFLRQSPRKIRARARAFIAERNVPELLVGQASEMDAGRKHKNFERAALRSSHRSECMRTLKTPCESKLKATLCCGRRCSISNGAMRAESRAVAIKDAARMIVPGKSLMSDNASTAVVLWSALAFCQNESARNAKSGCARNGSDCRAGALSKEQSGMACCVNRTAERIC